jgi:HAE1 family hydrophobic/amphiphilic exporter-1
MFSKFIHRPVLAIVLSVLVVFLGLLTIKGLPISQFPEIAPPRVMVTLAYPGASADVLIKSAIIPLERAINGVPGMTYIISDATSAGEATIQVIFALGTNPDLAVVNVKNRVDQAINLIPTLIQREGVVVQSVQPSMLMYVNLYSTEKAAKEQFLYNYANIHILPELQRIKGIGRAQILGSRTYAMRVWLNPERMRAYNVATPDVMAALAEQSVIGRPGRLGQSSGMQGQALEYTLVYQGRSSSGRIRTVKASASRIWARSSWAASSSTSIPTSTAIPRRPSCSSRTTEAARRRSSRRSRRPWRR